MNRSIREQQHAAGRKRKNRPEYAPVWQRIIFWIVGALLLLWALARIAQMFNYSDTLKNKPHQQTDASNKKR